MRMLELRKRKNVRNRRPINRDTVSFATSRDAVFDMAKLPLYSRTLFVAIQRDESSVVKDSAKGETKP